MEIDRDWGSWTGSLLEGSLANSLMKTADESRSGKPDKKRMVPRVNAPGWSFGVCFFCLRFEIVISERNIMDLQTQLQELKTSTQAKLAEMRGEHSKELQELRVAVLGKKGSLTDLLKGLKDLPNEERPKVGKMVNEVRDVLTEAFDEAAKIVEAAKIQAQLDSESLDVTLPGRQVKLGNRHILSQTAEEIEDIFLGMGFQIVDGFEVETDYYNFERMNLPKDHPARDMQDTFFIESHPDILLRTHTSSVQTRAMEVSQPPIRIICPGRVYRNEAISYRAHCFFHQVEALYVDKDVSFTDLKQVLLLFAKEMFGADTKIRLRPSYFPFTEPSAEMDISCNICGGKGCPFCKHTGWVEILGCGMVDPNVLEANGIDSKIYSGYALGMGVERITNLKYQVKDLRMFSENDTRFLKEFEAAY